MKTSLIALLSICLPISLVAETVAILDSDTSIVLESDDGKFVTDFEKFTAKNKPFDKTMTLINPPEWGKTLSDETNGTIQFKKSFKGGFVGLLTLDRLEPNKPYRLTLNGNPNLKGNDLLPTPVPGLPDERFYDFLDIVSDSKGHYQSTLGIKLLAGEYDVRIYVKDTSDWKIVLYRDYFPFTVK